MAFEVSYNLENEQQFWDGKGALMRRPHHAWCTLLTRCATELDDIVSTRCRQHDYEIIDNALRSFLNVTTNYRCKYAPHYVT